MRWCLVSALQLEPSPGEEEGIAIAWYSNSILLFVCVCLCLLLLFLYEGSVFLGNFENGFRGITVFPSLVLTFSMVAVFFQGESIFCNFLRKVNSDSELDTICADLTPNSRN